MSSLPASPVFILSTITSEKRLNIKVPSNATDGINTRHRTKEVLTARLIFLRDLIELTGYFTKSTPKYVYFKRGLMRTYKRKSNQAAKRSRTALSTLGRSHNTDIL